MWDVWMINLEFRPARRWKVDLRNRSFGTKETGYERTHAWRYYRGACQVSKCVVDAVVHGLIQYCTEYLNRTSVDLH